MQLFFSIRTFFLKRIASKMLAEEEREAQDVGFDRHAHACFLKSQLIVQDKKMRGVTARNCFFLFTISIRYLLHFRLQISSFRIDYKLIE
uniref:Secreted protein n=1 Tax=Caenorhabditis tropicalis TaxID=1561998 RepID=A0A1I7V3Q5_9PELO